MDTKIDLNTPSKILPARVQARCIAYHMSYVHIIHFWAVTTENIMIKYKNHNLLPIHCIVFITNLSVPRSKNDPTTKLLIIKMDCLRCQQGLNFLFWGLILFFYYAMIATQHYVTFHNAVLHQMSKFVISVLLPEFFGSCGLVIYVKWNTAI